MNPRSPNMKSNLIRSFLWIANVAALIAAVYFGVVAGHAAAMALGAA